MFNVSCVWETFHPHSKSGPTGMSHTKSPTGNWTHRSLLFSSVVTTEGRLTSAGRNSSSGLQNTSVDDTVDLRNCETTVVHPINLRLRIHGPQKTRRCTYPQFSTTTPQTNASKEFSLYCVSERYRPHYPTMVSAIVL